MVKFKIEVVKCAFNHSEKAASQKYGVHREFVQTCMVPSRD